MRSNHVSFVAVGAVLAVGAVGAVAVLGGVTIPSREIAAHVVGEDHLHMVVAEVGHPVVVGCVPGTLETHTSIGHGRHVTASHVIARVAVDSGVVGGDQPLGDRVHERHEHGVGGEAGERVHV